MTYSITAIRTMRGIQQPLLLPKPLPLQLAFPEPQGAVYTKRWVVDLLLDLAGYMASENLVDAVAVEPSAGDGAFLERMVQRLVDSCKRIGRPISDCRNSLIGYELDEQSARRTRALTAQTLIERGVEHSTATGLADAWVQCGDYLLESINLSADFVVGNPPYVRLEEIPEETALLYRSAFRTMRGRADIYVAFFEAALHQLKDGGVCAFICADRWMRNQYGAELRKLITSEFAVDMILEMHDADAFHDEVDAYPAITLIRRQRQGKTVVASAGSEIENVPFGELATLLKNAECEKSAMPVGLNIALVDSWFNGSDPWPCQSPEQLALLRRLEDSFPPLEKSARIGIGVATGNDRVFVTKDPNLVEPGRLLKLALSKDIGDGTMKWSGHYLVNPWNCQALVELEQYPRLRGYFEAHESALRNRHTAIKSSHAWYKTIDRVSHALTEKPKLYIADIKILLDPVLDSGETYPHHNLYFIQSDDWDLEVLGGLLMSTIGQFFIESYGIRMRGGYMRFQAQYLRRIRVPDPATLSEALKLDLIKAFRARDRQLATETALSIYGMSEHEGKIAIGHRQAAPRSCPELLERS